MQKALLILVVATGLGLGLLWPVQSQTSVNGASGPADVVLQRSSDRHFYATGTINGRSVRFLVDTGASAIALTEEDARKVGIPVTGDDYELIGEGASGLVRGKYIELDQVDVEGIKQEGVRAAVVQGAKVSLLGQPFLEQLDEIVIRKETMTLRAASGS